MPAEDSGAPSSSSSPPDEEPSADDGIYRALGLAAVGLIAFGTVIYHVLEDWSWVDALYFSVIAVTTVGFGDISLSTEASKLFTVVYIVAGIYIIVTFHDARMKRHGARRRRSRRDQ